MLTLVACRVLRTDKRGKTWHAISDSCEALWVTHFDAYESTAIARVLEERRQRRIPDEPTDQPVRNDEGAAYAMSPIAHGPRGMFVARWGPPEDVHSVVRIFVPDVGWSPPLDALHDLAAMDEWTCNERQCLMLASFEFSSVRAFQFDLAGVAVAADALVLLEPPPQRYARVDYGEFGQEQGELRVTRAAGRTDVLYLARSLLACTDVRNGDAKLAFACLLHTGNGVDRVRIRCAL